MDAIDPSKPVGRMLAGNRYRNAQIKLKEASEAISFIKKTVPAVAGTKIPALDVVVALAEVELRRRSEKVQEAVTLCILHVAQKFDVDPDDIRMSTAWGCENKGLVNACYYDVREDPCTDQCLYCDQPTERK